MVVLLAALAVCALCAVLGLRWVFEPALAAAKVQRMKREKAAAPAGEGGEQWYTHWAGGDAKGKGDKRERRRFPSLFRDGDAGGEGEGEKGRVMFSLIVPAYKEEERMPVMMDAALAFMREWEQETAAAAAAEEDAAAAPEVAESRGFARFFEIIVVDDGSTDATAEVGESYSQKHGSEVVRVLRLDQNRGKGGAVREGMLRGRGAYLLMVDADGATEISDLKNVYRALRGAQTAAEPPLGVGFGSRAHMQEDAVATRAFYRTILMYGFHALVSILCTTSIKDTQCGFKLFTRQAARDLFSVLHLERWAFDIELVYLCQRKRIPVVEVPVNWHEVDGSKLIQGKWDVVFTSLNMARDMLCVRLSYLFGIWSEDPWCVPTW